MSAPTSGHGAVTGRFAPYIEELQEFFASSCLRCGAPEDVIDLMERLESSPTFAEDLSSMVRSIVLREGGGLPHSQLLEILALAIGGPKMDHAAQQFSQPLRNLLSFLSGVVRKPWNEPPGEPVRPHHAEILPFRTKPRSPGDRPGGQAAAISAAADRAAQSATAQHTVCEIDMAHADALRLHATRADAVLLRPVAPDSLSESHREREVPDLVGEPTPAETSALDPETPSHEAIPDPDLPKGRGPEDVSSAVAASSVGPIAPGYPAGAESAPAPAAPASWQLAAAALRNGAAVPAEPSQRVSPSPSPASSPLVNVAGNAASTPSALDPKPHAQPAPASIPTAAAVKSEGAAASLRQSPSEPVPPRAASPPRASAPLGAMDSLQPSFAPHMPRTPAGMLVAAAAMLVLAGIFAASFHRTTELVGKQLATTQPATTATPATTPPATGTSNAIPARAAVVPALAAVTPAPRIRRVVASDDEEDDESDVAAPYSTPIPGRAQAKPTAYVASPAQEPPANHALRPPPNEVASTGPIPAPPSVGSGAGYSGQSGAGYPAQSGGGYPVQSYAGGQSVLHAYRNPDGAIAGDVPLRGSRAVLEDHPRYVDVSSGMMAGNLISAPMPDYPTLARFTHVSGEVVIQAVIAKNGSVLATHVLRGNRLLRGAAQDAVRRWRYRPYMMEGHPVEVSTIVTVRFKPKG